MANTDFDLIRMREEEEYEDISSNYTDISSSSPKEKKKRKKKHFLAKFISFLLVLTVALGVAFFAFSYRLIESIPREDLDNEDLGISSSDYDEVKNIALLGIDARSDTDVGRSDAVVILTVDKKHNKIKLTSIARDSYVSIDGHKKDKLTHAYAYGKSQLAVKTLNQNFELEITDYVTMNFFEFVSIIDYIGGVTIDVDEKELREMNTNIIPYLSEMGIKGKLLEKSGVQLLDGAQALCYARIRHIDSDIKRGNRQKEVLTAMFQSAVNTEITKLPNIAKMVLSKCRTSLETKDIISMGLWAVTSSPEFEQLSIPNDNVKSSGKIISGKWCYVLDLDAAKKEIYDFIYEINYYSPEAKAQREEDE